jgi:class 3 adenylate cyclase
MTLLVTELDQGRQLYEEKGDAAAFTLIHEHFCLLRERIRAEGGALIKTIGEGVVAAFSDSAAAVRVGLDLQTLLARSGTLRGMRLKAGIHRGPALAATVNDHLDYFGATVRLAMALPTLARAGELVLTQAVAADPQVAAVLCSQGLEGEIFEAPAPGPAGRTLVRVNLANQ